MAKDMELLQKMELTDESRAKLTALLEEAKKTKKVASKALVEALDAADATEEQTEQFYDVLEAAGVEIDVSDVLDLIGSSDALDSPTIDDMEAIENGELEAAPTDEELERYDDLGDGKLDDPVRRRSSRLPNVWRRATRRRTSACPRQTCVWSCPLPSATSGAGCSFLTSFRRAISAL